MAALPYLSAPSNIEKALNGIRNAAVPERVSQDFVKTILQIPGGSGDQMTAFLKKLGFSAPNGAPTELYRKFRNPATSGTAVAAAIRSAYAPLFLRNEFMYKLSDDQLQALIVEETGLATDSPVPRLTTACIVNLKKFASFETVAAPLGADLQPPASLPEREVAEARRQEQQGGGLKLNLGYTINLNLPATSDPKVFDAIFKSLKEHLLRDDDA